jgi:hypothetical protein
MESKAQKAALAYVKEKIIKSISEKNEYGYHIRDLEFIKEQLDHISGWIKEYSLENKIFTDVIEKAYDVFMEERRYSDSASFAKKYGL